MEYTDELLTLADALRSRVGRWNRPEHSGARRMVDISTQEVMAAHAIVLKKPANEQIDACLHQLHRLYGWATRTARLLETWRPDKDTEEARTTRVHQAQAAREVSDSLGLLLHHIHTRKEDDAIISPFG